MLGSVERMGKVRALCSGDRAEQTPDIPASSRTDSEILFGRKKKERKSREKGGGGEEEEKEEQGG